MYGSFFGSQIKCPYTTEDVGLNCNRLDTQVSNSATEHTVLYVCYNIILKIALCQDWIRKAERIRCSAPLPEGSPDPLLTRMLERAPFQVPSREDEGRNREATDGPNFLHIQIGGVGASAKEDNQGGESKNPSPQAKKRAASEDLVTVASKRGSKPSPKGPAPGGVITAQRPQGGEPTTEP